MIDVAWTEILFIALVALLFLGPEELPRVLRWIGSLVGKVQAFSHSFYAHLEEIQEFPPSALSSSSEKDKDTQK